MNLAVVIVFSILTFIALVWALAIVQASHLHSKSAGMKLLTFMVCVFIIAVPATLIYVGLVLE